MANQISWWASGIKSPKIVEGFLSKLMLSATLAGYSPWVVTQALKLTWHHRNLLGYLFEVHIGPEYKPGWQLIGYIVISIQPNGRRRIIESVVYDQAKPVSVHAEISDAAIKRLLSRPGLPRSL